MFYNCIFLYIINIPVVRYIGIIFYNISYTLYTFYSLVIFLIIVIIIKISNIAIIIKILHVYCIRIFYLFIFCYIHSNYFLNQLT